MDRKIIAEIVNESLNELEVERGKDYYSKYFVDFVDLDGKLMINDALAAVTKQSIETSLEVLIKTLAKIL